MSHLRLSATLGVRRARGASRGFTLIELLVATAVFVGLLLLLLDGWAQSARATTQARQQAMALGVARERMESLVALPFASTVPVPSGTRTVSATVGGNPASTTFTWTASESLITSDSKRRWVVVSWQDGGLTHHVDLETLVCNGL